MIHLVYLDNKEKVLEKIMSGLLPLILSAMARHLRNFGTSIWIIKEIDIIRRLVKFLSETKLTVITVVQ